MAPAGRGRFRGLTTRVWCVSGGGAGVGRRACRGLPGRPGQIARTLRAVCGLTTAQIARAFLVPESTVGRRITRAKRKIRDAGIAYRIPGPGDLGGRLAEVLAVIYLLFNEGYAASSGADLLRPDLCAEAIRLARLLRRLMPAEPEVGGLTALMLFQDARRAARVAEAGGRGPLG